MAISLGTRFVLLSAVLENYLNIWCYYIVYCCCLFNDMAASALTLSQEKLKDVLGLDDEELVLANEEAMQSWEQATESQMESVNRQLLANKRKQEKAIKVLGCDPSASKLVKSLGLKDEEELRGIVEETELSSIEYSRQISDQIATSATRKRELQKPLKVLGFDPSHARMQKVLGLGEEELQEALEEVEQLRQALLEESEKEEFDEEFEIKQVPPSIKIFVRSSPKLSKIFGYDPSVEKLKSLLGVTEPELTVALRESAESRMEVIAGLNNNDQE